MKGRTESPVALRLPVCLRLCWMCAHASATTVIRMLWVLDAKGPYGVRGKNFIIMKLLRIILLSLLGTFSQAGVAAIAQSQAPTVTHVQNKPRIEFKFRELQAKRDGVMRTSSACVQ
jgi:hypothetical protein